MALIYILVIIVKAPLLLLRYVFSQRWILFMVIIGGVVIVALTSYAKIKQVNVSNVPAYQIEIPSTTMANQVATTPSRVYYVVSSRWEGDYLVLTEYYEYNTKWEHKISPPDEPVYLKRDRVRLEGR